MKGKLFIIFSFLFTLAGCEKDFTLPDKSGMVINSLFNSGGTMQVFLSTSYPGTNLNNNVTAISNAQIALYENNIFKEYLHYIPADTGNNFGAYYSNLVPQNNHAYSITVNAPGYETASAADTIPQPAQIIACNLVRFPQTGTGKALANLIFQDDPSVLNFYRLNTWLVGNTFVVDSNYDTILTPFLTAIEPYVLNGVNDTVRDDPKFLLFSDRGFNGQIKELQIQCSAHSVRNNVYNEAMLIELHTVSYSHYEYFKTYATWRLGGGSTNVAGYVYSNVINGYGIFAGENWKENVLVLE
jgi:Domain of unknown function (DUF4249)